ncbi:hypothetical protein [Qipengyuania qiaonensis]|uniref:DUF2059 domain-containing protein n=1 Tax=Qipengyuania qiaonensis TaxID=2867240 RepID=A0ABS7J8J8_9SPHN|nr:hypothetical protein [Qipengyuania qiaonensis]MBX7481978.1 hypothetical protein [Qipengyuania qiaonensis]
MRKLVFPVMLGALLLPAPAFAQDYAPEASAPLADLGEQMRDPARQREMALMLQAMTEVLLDMPVAPLAQAAADMAGETAQDIDPELTLRQIAPDAGRVSEEVARNVPRAMQAAGSMAEGVAAMAPMLRDMADRMRAAMPPRD